MQKFGRMQTFGGYLALPIPNKSLVRGFRFSELYSAIVLITSDERIILIDDAKERTKLLVQSDFFPKI